MCTRPPHPSTNGTGGKITTAMRLRCLCLFLPSAICSFLMVDAALLERFEEPHMRSQISLDLCRVASYFSGLSLQSHGAAEPTFQRKALPFLVSSILYILPGVLLLERDYYLERIESSARPVNTFLTCSVILGLYEETIHTHMV